MKDKTEPEPVPRPVEASQWKDRNRPLRRTFPGPPGASSPLRVALSRGAYAELTAHAKESLEAEVAGVLAGHLCEDDDGRFLDVQAVVRAAGTRQGRGHVTFTQESWNGIHASLERDHPKLQIVGWYHTHPGFGVEFSDMDVFIQKNFFAQPWQVALLTDPLGGDLAVAMNGDSGLLYLDRFWVGGREQRCRVPVPRGTAAPDVASAQLDARMAQLAAAVHELRQTVHRALFAAAFVLLLSAGLTMAYAMNRIWFATVRPPEHVAFVPVPITLDGKPALIGLSVVKWSIPPELLAVAPEEPAGSTFPAAPASPAPSAAPSNGVPR